MAAAGLLVTLSFFFSMLSHLKIVQNCFTNSYFKYFISLKQHPVVWGFFPPKYILYQKSINAHTEDSEHTTLNREMRQFPLSTDSVFPRFRILAPGHQF